MSDRADTSNVVASLVAFVVFMVVLLVVPDYGVGAPELLIWCALLAVGTWLIVRRHRIARARRERDRADVEAWPTS